LKVTKEKEEDRQAFLTVEMEPAEMEGALEDSFKSLSKKVNVPGFRRGRAPRAVIERHLGRDRLIEEAMRKLVPQAYEQALKEQEIEPFAQPEIEIAQTEPVIFKAVVPLEPTVELGDYRGIRMEPEPVVVTEEKVDAVLEELRHHYATWESVERPVAYNDLAVMDINGKVDEKPYVQKIGAQFQVLKDAVSPAPGFADQIVGMKKDEEREFKLSFPDDYPNTEVAGREGTFKVKVTEIKEEKLPEMDDKLAAQISPDFNTVALMREETRNRLRQNAEEQSRLDFDEKLINAVVEQAEVAFPPVLVEMEISRILNEQNRRVQMSGRGMEEYLQSINKTEEQLREELRPIATKNVNASLVIGKITEAEKIEVTDADIEKGIDGMADSTPEDKREDLRKLLDNPQTRQSIKQSLMTRKTVERLVQIAKNAVESKKETKTTKKKPTEEEAK
jgi:trigger factor